MATIVRSENLGPPDAATLQLRPYHHPKKPSPLLALPPSSRAFEPSRSVFASALSFRNFLVVDMR